MVHALCFFSSNKNRMLFIFAFECKQNRARLRKNKYDLSICKACAPKRFQQNYTTNKKENPLKFKKVFLFRGEQVNTLSSTPTKRKRFSSYFPRSIFLFHEVLSFLFHIYSLWIVNFFIGEY